MGKPLRAASIDLIVNCSGGPVRRAVPFGGEQWSEFFSFSQS
jgi:hypothetical protein